VSTALVRSEPRTVAAVSEPREMSFSEMMQMGTELAKTGFLPDAIKNGAQAAAIILAGREMGMPPMRALRSLVLVKGKVTESADSQLARFKSDGGHAKFTTLDETKAVLWLRHPNGDEHTETFTMDDAKRAGLTSSGMYQKFAKPMLRSRAITAGLKSIGWEGGAGVYDPSELAAPETQDDTTADAVVEDAMTDAQHDLLHNLIKSHVFTDKERSRVTKVQTKDAASKAIEWAQSEVAKRKAAEKVDAAVAVTEDEVA